MENTEFVKGAIKPFECLKEAWELIKPQYWLLFAVTIVGVLIGGATIYILVGAMICGIYYCFFQALDGKKVEFEGLFKGFNYFMPSLLVTALIVIPVFGFIIIVYVPLIMVSFIGKRMTPDQSLTFMFGMIALEIIVSILMICLQTLLIFAYPLIVDRNLSGWLAVKTSVRAVWANLGGIAGLMGVMMLLAIVGYMALCIGVYFTIPVMMASTLVAYRKVFPKIDVETFNNPPPPNIYKI